MTSAELVARMLEAGVEVRGENGELRLNAPKGVLTHEIRELLAERKAEILTYLAEAPQAGRVVRGGGLRRHERGEQVLQSFAQQRLWFLDQVEPHSAVYNMTPAFRLLGPLDHEALGRSLNEIVRRHEALRTRLESANGTPVQVIDEHRTLSLPLTDLSHLTESERSAETRRLLAEDARRPFDLANDLLVRASLLRLGADEHILGLVIHHAIFDGWSVGVLLRELAALYPAYEANRPSPLPELPLQYADYSDWQRSWLEGGELQRQSDYWLSHLAGLPPALDLPADRARPPVFTGRGATVPWKVAGRTVDGLAALARSERATLFMALLAVFDVLLHRYTQSPDVVVGSPIANRGRAELENLIGLFANTLVLRTDLDGRPTFRETLRRVRSVCIGAYAHSEMPFERLVQELRPMRDMSRTPLFQAMLALEDTGPGSTRLGDVMLDRFEVDVAVARTDLSVWLRPERDGLSGSVEYRVDLFDDETIRRMLIGLDTILGEVIVDPDRPIDAIPVLGASERRRLVEEWNATRRSVSAASVVERVGHRVAADPDRAVVSGSGRQLTYGELWTRAGRVAQYLREQDVGRGSIVGVSMERSPEMVVALLGVWRSGAAYLPLDPEFPADRLSFMVEDSGACLVLTDGDAPTSPWDTEAVTLVEAERLGAESDGDQKTAVVIESGDLAYVLYTSGSTGRPKGVEVEHGNLTNFLESMATEPRLTEDDVMLAVTTLSFDIAGLELWLPLWVGARVEIAERDETRDGRGLLERLDASGATVMQATPSTWRMLLESGWTGRLAKILCGGEPFPRDLVEPLLERADEVWNLYGPTETTIWSTARRVGAVDERAVPIGRPIANTQVYVMDPHGRSTPQGVPGELWIGGHGVARGYHDRADLTADRFVASPFHEGARVYRTGDLVRWRNDGLLEHLGRLDDQVKVHGHRIELGEIEAVLADHDDVRQAVAAVKGGEGEARLVAFIVSEPGRPVIGSELRRFLRQRLPAYMVPGVIIEIDAVPLAPNGKVDRRALPDPAASATRREYAAPTTDAEQQITNVWKALLNIERVSIHDNFFELGGHSLLAIRAVAMFAEESGGRIDPRELFFQTLQQIAASSQEPRP